MSLKRKIVVLQNFIGFGLEFEDGESEGVCNLELDKFLIENSKFKY